MILYISPSHRLVSLHSPTEFCSLRFCCLSGRLCSRAPKGSGMKLCWWWAHWCGWEGSQICIVNMFSLQFHTFISIFTPGLNYSKPRNKNGNTMRLEAHWAFWFISDAHRSCSKEQSSCCGTWTLHKWINYHFTQKWSRCCCCRFLVLFKVIVCVSVGINVVSVLVPEGILGRVLRVLVASVVKRWAQCVFPQL